MIGGWSRRAAIMLLTLLLLAAVSACRERIPQVIEIPTQMVLPPPTEIPPSDTPTRTPFPTWTFTFTPSHTPTLTPSFTLTPSNTYTRTFTPTFTDTPTFTLTPSPTLTPSETLFPTLTPSDTPTPSNTPTPRPSRTPRPTIQQDTPTPFGGVSPTFTLQPAPTIFSFTANQNFVLANTPVLLSWSSDGQVARLEQIDASGSAIYQSIPVPPNGQYSILAQSTSSSQQVIFRLMVSTNGIVTSSQPVVVGITCPANWFFGDQFAPAGTGCPAAVGAIGQGAFQRFERGFMVYINANGLNRICAVQDSGSAYLCMVNGWDGHSINTSPAPNGGPIPAQMFNWAYYNTLGLGGTWNSVIGWPVMDIAVGDRTIQFENSLGWGNPFFVDTADGTVVHFSGGDSGTWVRVR